MGEKKNKDQVGESRFCKAKATIGEANPGKLGDAIGRASGQRRTMAGI